MDTKTTTPVSAGKQLPNLSKDRKWRSFPKVPHLLQYIGSGVYYARVKVNGKVIRRSLDTDAFSTAKLRLPDFVQEQRAKTAEFPAPTIEEALAAYRSKLQHDISIKPRTLEYRELCLSKILATWQGIEKMLLSEIQPQACREWTHRLKAEIAPQYFNNVMATLRHVLDSGIRMHAERGGRALENPMKEISRIKIPARKLKLPEPSQFTDLVAEIRKNSGAWKRGAADLVEFLAYSGMRINSEACWVTWEDVDWQRKEIVVRGDPETATKNSETRRIPIIKNMETLLHRLKGSEANSTGAIMKVGECRGALKRACRVIGIPALTHHDLRHLFATRCIESGVDIPTVARWLGHKDGGVLAMKTYGHLRNEHSREMAEKVRF